MVDLQAGLMSVRKLVVVVIQSTGPGGAGGRTIAGQNYSGISPRGENAAGRGRSRAEAETREGLDASGTCDWRRQEGRRIDQIQLPASGLSPIANHRKSYSRNEPRNC